MARDRNVCGSSSVQRKRAYLSSAAFIEPGERTGSYRIGGDQLLTDSKGESRISAEDFAVALLDEIERLRHVRERVTVA